MPFCQVHAAVTGAAPAAFFRMGGTPVLQSAHGELEGTYQRESGGVPRQSLHSGTRIMVSVIVDHFAAGVSRDQIRASYPALTNADLDAALAYAAHPVGFTVTRQS